MVGGEYPYQDGDDYYVLERLENGKVNIIWSCWDDQSEIFYDEKKDEQEFPPLYFDALVVAQKYCKATGLTINQVYDYTPKFN
jgi:hypothetical protein